MGNYSGVAPGVNFQEQIEESAASVGISNAIGIVGVALKGSLDAVKVSNPKDAVSLFGAPHANNTAVAGMLACLQYSSEVVFKRVVSENAAEAITWEPTITEGSAAMPSIAVDGTESQVTVGKAFVGGSVKVTTTDGENEIVYTDVVNDQGDTGVLTIDGVGSYGTVEYSTGVITLVLSVAAVAEVTVSAEFLETDAAGRPWAVFVTKDVSELYNGWSIRLSWSATGSGDDAVWKVLYELRDSSGVLVESNLCDEDPASELYLETIINSYSSYISVALEGDPGLREPVTYVFSGGNSGLDATVDDIIGVSNSGMKAFYDPESVDISTLIVPNWPDVRVWKEGIAIGHYRKDIVFIPSLPVGLTPAQVADLVTASGVFTSSGYNFDETFVPLYWPNGMKRNTTTGVLEVVDIAPYVAATYAHSDLQSNIWMTPAGVKRGVISGLDGLEYKATKEERDMLYSTDLNINSVVMVQGYGATLMGARSSKRFSIVATNTALRYINIRRLCNYFRKIVLMESIKNLFDPNDYYTWNDWKMRLDPYFREVQTGRGLYAYVIVMDESTVSQSDIDAGRMPGTIRIAPTKPNEYIDINFVVAADGTVSFE